MHPRSTIATRRAAAIARQALAPPPDPLRGCVVIGHTIEASPMRRGPQSRRPTQPVEVELIGPKGTTKVVARRYTNGHVAMEPTWDPPVLPAPELVAIPRHFGRQPSDPTRVAPTPQPVMVQRENLEPMLDPKRRSNK